MSRIYAMQYPDGSIDDSILYRERDFDSSIGEPYEHQAMDARMRLMFRDEFNEEFDHVNPLHKAAMRELYRLYERCKMVRVKIVSVEVQE
jgi:hypothetical protein